MITEKKPYLYHGSVRKLNVGDKLLCHTQYNHNSSDTVSGVFATSDLDRAKYFGIINCVRANIPNTRSRKSKKKLYLEDIRPDIIKKFYIYSVEAKDFVLDDADEYICDHDVVICDVAEFDLITTLEQEGWEIYKIPHVDKKLSVSQQIEQMTEFIKSGQAYRVDLSENTQK